MILLGTGDGADAKRRLLERAQASVVGEDSTAALAIVAIEDEADARAAVARLKARGILVNAVDRSDLCDFTLPAIVDRDPVLIAIGTGGASAGLAKALRQRLETLLPASLGQTARTLSAARSELRARFPDPADRRRAIDTALRERGPLDLLGHRNGPHTVLDFDTDTLQNETVAIELASDDPDDLTLRQARLLAGADRIYHDRTVSGSILARARADAPQVMGDAPATPGPGLTLLLRMTR